MSLTAGHRGRVIRTPDFPCMSVLITFEPSGISGLVAEGTCLLDAARRMGAPLGTGCTGRGDCVDCEVLITTGTALLSTPTEAETSVLGVDRLAQAHRLVCHVIVQRTGELVVSATSEKDKATVPHNEQSELLKKFGKLSLDKKIATLVQFEAVTISAAFDAAIEKPLALGARALDELARRARLAREQGRHKKQPPKQGGKSQ